MGKDAPGPRKRQRASTNTDLSDIQNISHHQVKRRCRRECVTCKGQNIVDRPIRRAPLDSFQPIREELGREQILYLGV